MAVTTEVIAREGNEKTHQKTHGQQAPEEVFNTTNNYRKANQTTAVRYNLTWVRMAIIKKVASAGGDVQKGEPSWKLLVGMLSWCSHYREQYGGALEHRRVSI